jgi:hypothetical protein
MSYNVDSMGSLLVAKRKVNLGERSATSETA